MRFTPTELPGVVLIQPDVLRDGRGLFFEAYNAAKFRAAGITEAFVQDNYSRSIRNALRGLHLQVGRPQGKLIRVVEGQIWDVAVDVRIGSPTFGRWIGSTLSSDDFTLCWIPPGFAHGFAVTSEIAEVEYKCTELYDPASEVGIAWNDPQLAIKWPVQAPILSDRDRQNPTLAALGGRLPRMQHATNL